MNQARSTESAGLLHTPRPQDLETMRTAEVRAAFVVENLFQSDRIAFTFTDLDRMAIAGVAPRAGSPMTLENDRRTGRSFFLERRELGAINLGGAGMVRVDGKPHEMGRLDMLYIGVGTKSVVFESKADPSAKFYLVSCPAHQPHPTALLRRNEQKPIALGSQATANQRQIFQCIHEGGIRSCQLVMGYTELATGSVWNTMPPHTHLRRSEIYFYFDLPGGEVVSHFLGEPRATRHVFLHNEQAVLSPPWSIHAGCGTSSYKFVWAMAGENQTFDDMDKVAALDLL